ncbi:CbiQ family ECF transporter T component [Leadbettera azotonutricia]|uniref:Cobalt transport protein n=1 Tax=Leadbettera azotonutricia (strain ATCC BAA-888 / DSM 13862 / ZAS-9) TaxID=545695 RepID=F5YCT2_LEAAZ|nr:CbiQ family ECF transporter T component [Leadbettera azotonutricia]AEF83052.1 cobalt transport protein [Leadbettera azotonutricia ZAS-9]
MIKNRQCPWAYRKGNSFVHRLNGGVKLLILLLLSIAVFFPNFIVLPVIGMILVLGALNAGIKPWELLRGSGPLFMIVIAVILLQGFHISPFSFDSSGLKEGCIFGIQMALSFSAGALLFSVATMGEIKKSLARLEALLHVKHLRLSLGLSLMLGFLPRFFEVWESAELAWESRGGKKSLRFFIVIMPLVIEGLMETAAETAAALESRGALMID